jgi:hypothetical protein
MKRTIILTLCVVIGGWLFAKTQEVSSVERPYFYGEFKFGTVFFSDGRASRAMLNYNFVSQKMQFLDHQNNDRVLDLVHSPDITHIEIGSDIFVPVENFWFGFVIQDGPISLLKRKRVIVEASKSGGYGTPNSTAAADNIGSLQVSGAAVGQIQYNFAPATKTRVEQRFYLMKDRKTYVASRRNFLRLYPEVRPQLERFFKENRIDFKNEQHLRGLSMYANSLLMAQ